MINRQFRFFLLLVLATGADTFAKPLKIHMLSGSGEYKSAVSLSKWAKLLEKDGHTADRLGCQEKEDANLKTATSSSSASWKLKDEALEADGRHTPAGHGIRTASMPSNLAGL